MNILIITDKPVKDPNVVIKHWESRIRYINSGYHPCGEGYIIVVKEYKLTPNEEIWFNDNILPRMLEWWMVYALTDKY